MNQELESIAIQLATDVNNACEKHYKLAIQRGLIFADAGDLTRRVKDVAVYFLESRQENIGEKPE